MFVFAFVAVFLAVVGRIVDYGRGEIGSLSGELPQTTHFSLAAS